MALVTFLGTPSMTFFRGSRSGCVEMWLPGEARDLDDDVTALLLQEFPDAFSVATATPPAATKTAAVKAPKRKAPAAKTRAAKPKKGKA